MATNAIKGYISVSIPNSSVYLGFEWRVTRQEGMNSIISWSLTSDYRSYWHDSSFSGTYSVDINGTNLVSISGFNESKLAWMGDASRKRTLRSGTYTLPRSRITNTADFNIIITADGTLTRYQYGTTSGPDMVERPTSSPTETKTFSHNVSNAKEYIVYSTTTANAAAQIVSVSDFTDETGPTITYTYDRGTNVDAVSLLAGISFSGEGMDIQYREVSSTESSYTFNFTSEELSKLYTLLKNGPTATVRFYLLTIETVDDEIMNLEPTSLIKTFTFVNYEPVLTPTIQDINPVTKDLTGNDSHIIKYFSKVAYNMNVELRKGALDVIGCYIQNGGRIEEGFQSGTFENPTSNIFYFSATDDRGYTGTKSKTLSLFDGEFINYIKLSSSLKSTPISPEGTVNVTITGKYFNANFGDKQNKLDMQYAIYKKGTTPTWKPVQTIKPTMIDNETYTYTFSDEGLDYTAQYVVAVKVNDLLMSSESSVSIVAKPVFYWNNDEFIFNVPVTFNEGLEDALEEEEETVYPYEEGTATGYYMDSNGYPAVGDYTWTYRKWTDGSLECWCTVPITTNTGYYWGNLFLTQILYKTDLNYPIQPVGTPIVMTSLATGSALGILSADGDSYAADNISTGRYRIICGQETTNKNYKINYYVKGRWK